MKNLKRYLSAWLLFCSLSAFASSPAEQLDQLLSNFHAMSANFVQRTAVKNGAGKSSSGKMALKRPGKFRWEITKPNHQVIIADDQYLWIYDVDLEQATRKDINKDTSNSAILLSGSTRAIEQRFIIANFETRGDSRIFQLKPKSSQDMFQQVDLIFTNGNLSAMSVIDNLGQRNTFSFTNVKINPSLGSNLFQFTAPRGVDVVKE